MLVSDGTLVWIDHAAGTRRTVSMIEAEILMPENGTLAMTGSGQMDDAPLRLSLTAPEAAAVLAGRVSSVSVTVAAGGSTFGFEGRAGLIPAVAEGRVTADLADLRAIATLTGAAVPDIPEGLGRRVRELSGQMTLAPAGSVHLREAALTLDGNRLTLAADITFDGPRPRLAAQLGAGSCCCAGSRPQAARRQTRPPQAPMPAGAARPSTSRPLA